MINMDLNDYTDKEASKNIDLKDGIWFSGNNRKIYEPKSGNMNCQEIEKDRF